jgi:hypothetical protein
MRIPVISFMLIMTRVNGLVMTVKQDENRMPAR